MDIFIVQDNRVGITPQALLISPFKEIWEENDKDMALLKLGYIEFMCSYKKSNPFGGYLIDERPLKILISSFPNGTEEEYSSIMNDSLVIEGIALYIKNQAEASVSLRYYEAAVSAANKMADFFIDFELDTPNPKTGNPLYKPADITRALKDVNDIIKTLGALKDKVIQELNEDAKGKAGREINYFEKPKHDR